ncbi:hypothetical protein XU18_0294 [Perkinsela sp. CCAP 1560/4]|nr:hypothetical protein XU18_0294 [Perkinsela sp. CCAP 1560/4]|eukprot:KNH09609.1 hypothetical protein XU18_0294 [Perkinsela sp. CCAP 1560/4]
MKISATSIAHKFQKFLEENKANEIIREAESILRTQRPLQESVTCVAEARFVLSILFRACGEMGNIELARKFFQKAKREDDERKTVKGFCPHFNIPYTVRSASKVSFEGIYKGKTLQDIASSWRFNILNTPVCNMYLHTLASSEVNQLYFEEIRSVRSVFDRFGFVSNAHTYQYLMEMHYRSGLDVTPLWWELRSKGIIPTTMSLRTPLSSIIVQHPDPCFVIDVVRVMVEKDAIEKNVILNVLESLSRNEACMCDQIIWVLFELEQVCVMEKVILIDILRSPSVPVRILCKAANRGEFGITKLVIAFMERHGFPRTHEVYGLSVYALARNNLVKDALDLVNQMAVQGLLEGEEAQKKFYLESVNISMEYHYLYALAMALSVSLDTVDSAYYYLEEKNIKDGSVSVHALDLVVLACARIHDEQRATETVEAYSKVFKLQPRVLTYLYLIQSCGGKNKSKNQKKVFKIILESGLRPTTAIYKLIIRQALAADNIDEALEFLDILGSEHLHDNKHWNREENFDIQKGEKPEEEVNRKKPGHRVKLEPETVKLFIDKALQKQDADLIIELLTRAHNEWNVLIDMKYLQMVEEKLFQFGFKMGKVKEAIKLHSKGYLKVPSR